MMELSQQRQTNKYGNLGNIMEQEIRIPNYSPSEAEPFMNDSQLQYFRNRLVAWKHQLLEEGCETINHLQESPQSESDVIDLASNEINRSIELRSRDRERKLISKIDDALRRIAEGTYGYCDETGEPISLKRLEARPIATLSLEAQERHERRERAYREEC